MARIIRTDVVETNGFRVVNEYTDGTNESHDFYTDSVVENFKFTKDRELLKKKCRICDVNIKHSRYATTRYVSPESCLAHDAKVKSVELDFSTELNSNTALIPQTDILDYEASKEVENVNIVPLKKVKISVLLSDETTSELEVTEGMTISNILIQKGNKEVTGEYKVLSFIYDMKVKGFKKPVSGLALLDADSNIIKVDISDIKKTGEKKSVEEHRTDDTHGTSEDSSSHPEQDSHMSEEIPTVKHYTRCESQEDEGALKVVEDSEESFDESTMVKKSDVIGDIEDIEAGDYVKVVE